MKRIIPLLVIFFLILFSNAAIAEMVADVEQHSEITDTSFLFPVDVIVLPEENEIQKIYELDKDADPSLIPSEDFERNGLIYKCSDIVRAVSAKEETKMITHTETVTSSRNETGTILSLLPETKEITTEDDYKGILTLNVSSIKTVVSGYGSNSSTKTITRDYPNLSSADMSHIPKTVSEGGVTYTFQNVDWQTDNWENVDDYEVANRHKAHVTYTATVSSSYVKGYTTTAEYTGEASRTDIKFIKYIVIFSGYKQNKDGTLKSAATEKRNVFNENSKFNSAWLYVIGAVLVLASILLVVIYLKRKKEKLYYEADETEDAYR